MDGDSSDDQLTRHSNDSSDDAPSSRQSGQTYCVSVKDEREPHGLQTISLSNMPSSTSNSSVIQYTPSADGPYFLPVHQLNSSVMSFSPGSIMMAGGDGLHGDEAGRKRELRLLKNKEAAKECRRKKKEYVKCLENRVAVLENQNKTLIEELKSLKELYCQKDGHS